MADPSFIDTAVRAAREAGALLREHHGAEHDVNEYHDHDLKLVLDVQSQELIFSILQEAYPDHALYGEEGILGDQSSDYQWIVDPIDGTVNYFYGIPHFCTSIALRHKGELMVGVIYDPMMDELFQVEKGKGTLLNGKPVKPSERTELSDAVITIGFSKTKESLDKGMVRFKEIAHQVRKTRMLGSAALGMAYISCGRLDGYIEETISLWDIAAGQLMIEEGGGKVQLVVQREKAEDKYSMVATNGRIDLGEPA